MTNSQPAREWAGAKSRGNNVVVAMLLPLATVAIWELAVRTGWWPRTIIASPAEVAHAAIDLIFSGKLLVHASVSIARIGCGFALGAFAGLLMGSAVGLSRTAERLLGPTIQVLAPVPPIAWIPLIIVLFGIDEASKVALIAVGVFFVVFLNTVEGIRGTDRGLVELSQLYGKGRLELIMAVLLPSAASRVLTGLRVALGLSWILLVAAELIASSEGLGWLIWDARNFTRPDDMLVGVAAVGVLGKLSDAGLAAAERYVVRWHQGFGGL